LSFRGGERRPREGKGGAGAVFLARAKGRKGDDSKLYKSKEKALGEKPPSSLHRKGDPGLRRKGKMFQGKAHGVSVARKNLPSG